MGQISISSLDREYGWALHTGLEHYPMGSLVYSRDVNRFELVSRSIPKYLELRNQPLLENLFALNPSHFEECTNDEAIN